MRHTLWPVLGDKWNVNVCWFPARGITDPLRDNAPLTWPNAGKIIKSRPQTPLISKLERDVQRWLVQSNVIHTLRVESRMWWKDWWIHCIYPFCVIRKPVTQAACRTLECVSAWCCSAWTRYSTTTATILVKMLGMTTLSLRSRSLIPWRLRGVQFSGLAGPII